MTSDTGIRLPTDFHFRNNKDSPFKSYWGPIKKLFSRTGYHLCINDIGLVYSANSTTDKNAVVQLEAVERGIVTIKGVQSGRYLGFNDKGVLCGMPTRDDCCLFHENMTRSNYSRYKSKKYCKEKWFIAISKRGNIKNGKKSRSRKRHSHFLPRPA